MTASRRAPRLAAVLALVLTLCAGLLIFNRSVPAQAAGDCTPTGTNITSRAYTDDDVTLTKIEDGSTVTQGQSTELRINFKALKNLKDGDYFTYTLSETSGLAVHIGGTSFPIVDPTTKTVIGCAVANLQSRTLTVVFNQAAADRSNGDGVTGWVTLSANIYFENLKEPGNYPITLTDTKTITVVVDEVPGQGPGEPDPTQFRKDGWQRSTSSDQALNWRVYFPRSEKDLTNVKLVDSSSDTNWWFNCSVPETATVVVLNKNRKIKDMDDPMAADEQAVADSVKVSCTKEQVTATVAKIPAGYLVILPSLIASVPDPMPSVVFNNTATLTADELDQAGQATQAVDLSGAGEGTGDTTSPSATESTTAVDTPSASESTSATQTPSVSSSQTAGTTPVVTASQPPSSTPIPAPSQPVPSAPGLPHTGR